MRLPVSLVYFIGGLQRSYIHYTSLNTYHLCSFSDWSCTRYHWEVCLQLSAPSDQSRGMPVYGNEYVRCIHIGSAGTCLGFTLCSRTNYVCLAGPMSLVGCSCMWVCVHLLHSSVLADWVYGLDAKMHFMSTWSLPISGLVCMCNWPVQISPPPLLPGIQDRCNPLLQHREGKTAVGLWPTAPDVGRCRGVVQRQRTREESTAREGTKCCEDFPPSANIAVDCVHSCNEFSACGYVKDTHIPRSTGVLCTVNQFHYLEVLFWDPHMCYYSSNVQLAERTYCECVLMWALPYSTTHSLVDRMLVAFLYNMLSGPLWTILYSSHELSSECMCLVLRTCMHAEWTSSIVKLISVSRVHSSIAKSECPTCSLLWGCF